MLRKRRSCNFLDPRPVTLEWQFQHLARSRLAADVRETKPPVGCPPTLHFTSLRCRDDHTLFANFKLCIFFLLLCCAHHDDGDSLGMNDDLVHPKCKEREIPVTQQNNTTKKPPHTTTHTQNQQSKTLVVVKQIALSETRLSVLFLRSSAVLSDALLSLPQCVSSLCLCLVIKVSFRLLFGSSSFLERVMFFSFFVPDGHSNLISADDLEYAV